MRSVASGVVRWLSGVAACLTGPAVSYCAEPPASSIWSIAFSAVEADTRSTFSSSGGKLVIPLGAEDYATFVQVSSGSSLSDAMRARRGKMLASETAVQARLTGGIEGTFDRVFVSAGIGPSLARLAHKSGGGVIRLGVIAHGDLWYRPAEGHAIHASLAADSAERSLWGRLRYGYRPAPLPFSFGPELAGSLSTTSRKIKAGLHMAGLSWWRFNADISGGLMWDRRGVGQYLSASVWLKY